MRDIYGLVINGREVLDGPTFPVPFPWDGSHVTRVVLADRQQVTQAVGAAEAAGEVARRLPLWRRAEILDAVAGELAQRREELAVLVTHEVGKPIKDSRAEVDRSVSTLHFAADATRALHDATIPLDAMKGGEGRFGAVVREPVGIIAAITGFNFPLLLACHKVGPAIGGGNTVVLKPTPQTSASSIELARLFADAGLPEGILNVVTGGREQGEQLVSDPRVRLITFTGSTAVGKNIAASAGYKRVLLELGSTAANIVDADANLTQAADRCVAGGFSAVGQSCISVQRIYAHQSIYAQFTAMLVDRVRALRIGDPRDDGVDVASVVSVEAAERIAAWIQAAEADGAQVMVGGARQGSVVEPTVISGIQSPMRVVRDEIFGPVIGVAPFSRFSEAIALVNDSRYGLQAGVFTNNLGHAMEAIQDIRSGSVLINDASSFRADHMPYGGVKDSGWGKEGPAAALAEMTERKVVMVRL